MTGATLAWCDDMFIHSQRLGGWITDYVDLEESMAAGTIAQETLAHTVALMTSAGLGVADRDTWIYERSAEDWYPSRLLWAPRRDWMSTVVRSYFFTQGLRVMRRHLDFGVRQRSQNLVRLIHAEQDVHVAHWARWLQLITRRAALRDQCSRSVEQALADVNDLFGYPDAAPDGDEMLRARPTQLATEWSDEVNADLERIGVDLVVDAPEPSTRQNAKGFPGFEEFLSQLTTARGPLGAPRYKVYE
jgi:1,2-phenylacetyl-CoA epoxidase catalytic subunit